MEVLHAKTLFIGVALVGWAGYATWRARTEHGTLERWGLRRTNLREAFFTTTAVALAATAVMAAAAGSRGTLAFHIHMLPLALLYPLWGLVQQLLVQALFVANLSSEPRQLPQALLVVLAAVLFGLVHLPDPTLMAATFLLGLAFTPIYLRWRNLWPLGLWHGLLGVLVYFWILGRDPWIEMFG